MTLSKTQLKHLKALVESEDQEIVCDGRHCMIDIINISRGTVNALLRHMVIRDAGYAGVGCDIFIPTPQAVQILKRPALADEIVQRVIAQKPFYVDDDGVIQDA